MVGSSTGRIAVALLLSSLSRQTNPVAALGERVDPVEVVHEPGHARIVGRMERNRPILSCAMWVSTMPLLRRRPHGLAVRVG